MRLYKHKKITWASIPDNYIIARDKKKWLTCHIISIITENKLQAHHKTHLHTVNVYNTWPSDPIKEINEYVEK